PMLPAFSTCSGPVINVPLGPASVKPYTQTRLSVLNACCKNFTSGPDNGALPYIHHFIEDKSRLPMSGCFAVIKYATGAPKKCVVRSFSTVSNNKSGVNV